MAEIQFYASQLGFVSHLAGSGLGFYGDSGFGSSVQVGSYQGKTFVTNSNGTALGPEAWNIRYGLHPQSGIIGTVGNPINLLAIPNYQATLNMRFVHSTPVRTQNVQVRTWDRSNIQNPPVGVDCKIAEIIHPDQTQTQNGSGSATWQTPSGSNYMSLVSSPGESGFRPNGAATTDTRHDWYMAITASPNSIGSKTQFGLYASLEYL